MKAIALLLLTLAAAPALEAGAPPDGGLPRDEILGVRLGMSPEDVARTMSRRARPGETLSYPKESWILDDGPYGHLVLRYGRDGGVRWITAHAREGGPAVRYSDVGDVRTAEPAGRYSYTWTIEPRDGRPACLVLARGDDPDALSSLSLAAFQPTVPLPGLVPDPER